MNREVDCRRQRVRRRPQSNISRRTVPLHRLRQQLSRLSEENRQVNASLQDTRRRLSEAEKLAQFGFWEVDLVRNRIFWSPQLYSLLGFDSTLNEPTLEAIIGKLAEEDGILYRQLVHRALQDGTPYRCDLRVVRENGESRWLYVRGDTIRGEDGTPLRLIGTVQDITERKTAEQHSEESATLLSLAMRNASAGVWRWDLESNIRYRSPHVYEILGFDETEITHAEIDTRSHPDDIPCMVEAFQRFLDGHVEDYEHEWRMQHKDGSWRWLLSRARAERRQDGTVRRVTGIYKDITKRKNFESERLNALAGLAETEKQLRTVGDNLADGFIFQLIVMPDGRRDFSYLSAGVETLTGLQREELYRNATLLYGILNPEDIPAAIAQEQQGAASLSRVEIHVRYRSASQETRWLTLRKFPRPHPSGGIIWDGIALDVTAQKRVESDREQLLQQILKLVDLDPLTNLVNHRCFHHVLRKAGQSAQDTGASLAIAIIDLDGFKFFNDAYGHLTGDEILVQVARFLESCCREEDAIARIGGDEFAICLPGMARPEADVWLAGLCERMRHLVFTPPDSSIAVPIKFSVGLAVLWEDGDTVREVLQQADRRSLLNKGGSVNEDVARLRHAFGDTVNGFSMLDALVAAVDNKDRYTRCHSEEVMHYAERIAMHFDLPPGEIESLKVAALLHDVGKIGVPNRVLRHPGKLSTSDYEAVKQHAALSGVLISAVPELTHIVDAVRHHHESWDGSGYPDGLGGEDIPFLARILAVADAYSAMTSDRPYRSGMSRERAGSVLRAGAGRQWDIRCVDALLLAEGINL